MAETLEMRQARLKALFEKIDNFVAHPWILYHEPFRVVGDVYYLGNSYVSTFLIDTGEGLILIDPGFQQMVYQVFDAVRKLGFETKDIKHIFLSHGHMDHVGATRVLQEYTGARVWIGRDDVFFFTERRDLIVNEHWVPEFTVTDTYDYEKPFEMGRVKINFVHSPGHTPGTTSFFIETTHRGEKVVCAMHGGLGLNGLTREELEENRLPIRLQSDFVNGLRTLGQRHVDVVLPSHMHNYDMLARKALDDGSGDAFVDPAAWKNMLDSQLEKAKEVLPELF